jgi:hypothetical protein
LILQGFKLFFDRSFISPLLPRHRPLIACQVKNWVKLFTNANGGGARERQQHQRPALTTNV